MSAGSQTQQPAAEQSTSGTDTPSEQQDSQVSALKFLQHLCSTTVLMNFQTTYALSQVVTPWDVSGGTDGKIDYDKLIREVPDGQPCCVSSLNLQLAGPD